MLLYNRLLAIYHIYTWACGAALLLTREGIDSLGGFIALNLDGLDAGADTFGCRLEEDTCAFVL